MKDKEYILIYGDLDGSICLFANAECFFTMKGNRLVQTEED